MNEQALVSSAGAGGLSSEGLTPCKSSFFNDNFGPVTDFPLLLVSGHAYPHLPLHFCEEVGAGGLNFLTGARDLKVRHISSSQVS